MNHNCKHNWFRCSMRIINYCITILFLNVCQCLVEPQVVHTNNWTMDKRKTNDDDEKKAVSWYEPRSPDGEVCIRGGKEFIEMGADHQVKSKSLDANEDLKITSSSFSKNSQIRLSCTNNTMEWLEGTLLRRRSETRVYKFNTRLLEAITDGDTAYMNRILAMGANPNATCRLNQVSACHVAATINNGSLALLLSAGAESMRTDKLGRTPLHLAAWAGHVKHITKLLDLPEKVAYAITTEDVKEIKKRNISCVNRPCELTGTLNTLPDAWSDGMEHNCRSIKESLPIFPPGWTALHAASSRAQHQCVKLLLAAGANSCAQDLLSRTPLDVVGCGHYLGQKIEVADFRETVKILLDAGGRFQRCTANAKNSPLHTAVELDSVEAVEELLEGGASATIWNCQGYTAMHVCLLNRRHELLQLIANYEFKNADPYIAAVDVKDRCGDTVLIAAIKEGWTQGVCIALGAGASVTRKDKYGDTPIHHAAALGNMDILQEVLTVAKFNSAVDFYNEKGETALCTAISHGQIDVAKMLLKVGASIEKVTTYNLNVLHIAAWHGNTDMLEFLLGYDSQITAKMINEPDESTFTPLVHAVSNNHPRCVDLLILKGAIVNFVFHINRGTEKVITTPLHIAANKNHFEITKAIVEHDKSTIHVVNSAGLLPLHEACSHGHRDIITFLLHKRANLSGHNERCKTKLAPIQMLMNNLSRPTEFMSDTFDSYISSQGMNLQESNCKVKVDYSILIPDESDMKQMRVIKALLNTGNRYEQDRLLLHPLVQSFLYLKWKSLLPFFYSIIAMHACFVLALNVYVLSVFYYKDKVKEVPCYFYSNAWKYIIYVTVFLIAIQEIIFIKIKNRRYFLCLETWLKFFAIGLAVFLPQVVSWEAESSPEWARLVATIALLSSWFEMMFLVSRFPDWGFYVLMFGKVAQKVFKILLSVGFLIFGFSVCFMIQFHAHAPFEGPWASFVKTMVMMTTEYDYQTTITKASAKEISASITILRLVFLTFLILVSICLMNLIVGVAVNNVNHLEMIGNIKRLEKQIEFITSLEDIVCHKVIRKILPKRIYRKWSTNQKIKTTIVLRPREATCSYYKRLPAHIREAIFETAQYRQKQMDEELGSMAFKMKLDEIHYAIVGTDENESRKRNYMLESAVTRMNEDIDTLRSDMTFIKNFLISNRRRTISSNKSSYL